MPLPVLCCLCSSGIPNCINTGSSLAGFHIASPIGFVHGVPYFFGLFDGVAANRAGLASRGCIAQGQ
ncbi:hypothetical protein P4S55_00510 [Shewanella sp. PP-Sp27a-2]